MAHMFSPYFMHFCGGNGCYHLSYSKISEQTDFEIQTESLPGSFCTCPLFPLLPVIQNPLVVSKLHGLET